MIRKLGKALQYAGILTSLVAGQNAYAQTQARDTSKVRSTNPSPQVVLTTRDTTLRNSQIHGTDFIFNVDKVNLSQGYRVSSVFPRGSSDFHASGAGSLEQVARSMGTPRGYHRGVNDRNFAGYLQNLSQETKLLDNNGVMLLNDALKSDDYISQRESRGIGSGLVILTAKEGTQTHRHLVYIQPRVQSTGTRLQTRTTANTQYQPTVSRDSSRNERSTQPVTPITPRAVAPVSPVPTPTRAEQRRQYEAGTDSSRIRIGAHGARTDTSTKVQPVATDSAVRRQDSSNVQTRTIIGVPYDLVRIHGDTLEPLKPYNTFNRGERDAYAAMVNEFKKGRHVHETHPGSGIYVVDRTPATADTSGRRMTARENAQDHGTNVRLNLDGILGRNGFIGGDAGIRYGSVGFSANYSQANNIMIDSLSTPLSKGRIGSGRKDEIDFKSLGLSVEVHPLGPFFIGGGANLWNYTLSSEEKILASDGSELKSAQNSKSQTEISERAFGGLEIPIKRFGLRVFGGYDTKKGGFGGAGLSFRLNRKQDRR